MKSKVKESLDEIDRGQGVSVEAGEKMMEAKKNKRYPVAAISRKQTVIFRNSRRIKSVAGRVLGRSRNRENLWENPPEATPAMKQAIEQFKDRFKNNEQWDGTFSV